MKRMPWTALCFLFAGLLAGQSLKVTSPAKGDAWKIGSTYTITWSSSGQVDRSVNIILIGTAGRVRIETKAANSGSYSWTIPASIQPGDYKLRISAPVADIYADSGSFSIVGGGAPPPPPPPAATLELTSPVGGECWPLDSDHAITWKSSNLGGTLNIDLLHGSSLVGTIAANVAVGAGAKPWKAGTFSGGKAAARSGYRVRLQHVSGGPKDESGDFTIDPASLPPDSPVIPPVQKIVPPTVKKPPVTLSDYAPRIKDFTAKDESPLEGEPLVISIHVENAAKARVVETARDKSFDLPLQDGAFKDPAWNRLTPVSSCEIKLIAENGIQKAEKSFTCTLSFPEPPTDKKSLPVISKFEAVPRMAKPGEAVHIDLEYRNATKGTIFQVENKTVRQERAQLSVFRDFSGTMDFTAPATTGTYTYELELINENGASLARTWQTVRPEMKIHGFSANARQFRNGDEVIFSYSFEGASQAVIKRIGDEDSRKTINVCGGKRCEGKYSFPFRGPGTYKLFIMNEYDPVLASQDVVLAQIQ